MFLSTVSAAALMLSAGAPQDATPFTQLAALDEPVVLTEVVVTGRRDPGNPAVAARARAEAQETPGAVAVVSVTLPASAK